MNPTEPKTMNEYIKDAVIEAMLQNGCNKLAAARALKISTQRIYRLIDKFKIHVDKKNKSIKIATDEGLVNNELPLYEWLPSDADEPDPEHQLKYNESTMCSKEI